MKTGFKQAKTIKPYSYTPKGWSKELTIPVGSIVNNSTACGHDDNYRFWQPQAEILKDFTGVSNSMLAHDLTYYGLNIPAEYCEPYPANV